MKRLTYETTYTNWQLRNGLRIFCAHQPWTKTFAASLSFRAGWNFESPEEASLTHLLEHLAFGGRNQALVEELAQQGGYVNGTTEWENTWLIAAGHHSLLEGALAVFANVLDEIPFDEEAVASEMVLIEHEMQSVQETSGELEFRQLLAEIAGDPSMAKPFPENVGNLKKLAPEDVRAFARRRFSPSNAVLVVVSSTAPEELQRLQEPLSRPSAGEPFRPREPALEKLGDNRLLARSQWGSHALVGVAHVYRPRERYPLGAVAMLNDIVAGGPHSKLFKELRVTSAMGYDVGGSINALSRYVITEAHAIVRKRDNLLALERIVEAYGSLAEDGFDEPAFQKAKLSMHRQFEQSEGNPVELCTWLVHEVWIAAEPWPKSYQSQLRDLTLNDARRIAADVFSPEHRVTVVAGSCGYFKKRRARAILDGRASRPRS